MSASAGRGRGELLRAPTPVRGRRHGRPKQICNAFFERTFSAPEVLELGAVLALWEMHDRPPRQQDGLTDKARAIQPGASHFQGNEDALWWESSTSVRKFNKNFDPEQGTLMVKCC